MQTRPLLKDPSRCTPYLVWLGFVDWWEERRRVTHSEAGEEVRDVITGGGPLTPERSVTLVQHVVGFVGLFGMLVLFTAWLAPPLVKSVAPVIGSGGLAGIAGGLSALVMAAVVIIPLLWIRKQLRYFCERGKQVLARREAKRLEQVDYTNQHVTGENDESEETDSEGSGDRH